MPVSISIISFMFEDMFRPKLLGNDNTSPLCSTGDVQNALAAFGNLFSDHLGPYDGVTMGC